MTTVVTADDTGTPGDGGGGATGVKTNSALPRH